MAHKLGSIGRNSAGYYRRDVGYREGKSGQQRFYLGKEHAEASIRALHLVRLWGLVEKRWQRDKSTETPLWDATTLTIANAIAKGLPTVTVDPSEDPAFMADGEPMATAALHVETWLQQLQADFPLIPLQLPEHLQSHQERRQRHRKADRLATVEVPGITLHGAIGQYSTWIAQTCVEPGSQHITPYGRTRQQQLGILTRLIGDLPLADMGTRQIDNILATLAGRPKSAKGIPIAPVTARNVMGQFRAFLKWANRSGQWRRPADYEHSRFKIRRTHEERAKMLTGEQVMTYTLDQLATLWEFARPRQRMLLLFGLNCGFGQMECATLRLDEIHLHERHLRLPSTEQDSWIRRLRNKTGVFGEWKLWDLTVNGIKWEKRHRPESKDAHLLLTSRGTRLFDPTSGDNHNTRVRNSWQDLTDRIHREHPEFPNLSFNRLRKTSANWMRERFGGEVTSMFLSHGNPFQSDNLVEAYSNKPWGKLVEAVEAFGTALQPIFATETDPFPDTKPRNYRSIPLATIKRIRQMKLEGLTVAKIAAETGVSVDTVRRC